MTFDEIKQESAKDLKIYPDDLVHSSIITPNLYNKYLKEYHITKDQLSRYMLTYKIVYRDKWLYYSGKADADAYKDKPFNLKITKQDLSIFMDADEELVEARYKVDVIEQKLDYLKKVLDEITRRSFHISNAIKMLKFTNGEM